MLRFTPPFSDDDSESEYYLKWSDEHKSAEAKTLKKAAAPRKRNVTRLQTCCASLPL